jgi:phage replication-related protein YjqB (UPF0714/DUF867 family)
MRYRDRYKNYEELCQHEQEGVDYRTCNQPRPAAVAIIAPHGGKIEPGTSEIAKAIAGSDYNLYLFEGIKRE